MTVAVTVPTVGLLNGGLTLLARPAGPRPPCLQWGRLLGRGLRQPPPTERREKIFKVEARETDLGNVPYMELGLGVLRLPLLLAGFFCLTEVALRLGTSASSILPPASLSWWDSEVRASMEPV